MNLVGGISDLKLIDFGIALHVTKSDETTSVSISSAMGTINYMPPEALRPGERKVGRPSDIWALGSILYKLVFKRMAFPQVHPCAKMVAICGDYTPDYTSVPGCDEDPPELENIVRIIKRCLVRKKSERINIYNLLNDEFVKKYMK